MSQTVEQLLNKMGPREASFRMAVSFLRTRAQLWTVRVIETGCVRQVDDFGAGYSTVLWSALREEGMLLNATSIDLSPTNCEIAKQLAPGVEVVCGDSVSVLSQMGGEEVDLLYLDSFDLDRRNPHPSSLHHMMELTAAEPLLVKGSLVMVDDNYGDVGKGKYVAEFMRLTGREMLFDGVQQIWRW